jgi:outer membrane lipoprotein carrier protein
MNSRPSWRDLRWLLLGLLMPLVVMSAQAVTTPLDRYLDGLKTWSADFTQDVSDASGRKVGQGRGRLVIVRPGRFRWESTPAGADPGAQMLIADGRNLWFYDRDLEQATVKPVSQALSQSPAMLLAGGNELRASFNLSPDGRRDGLEWVRVQSRDVQSDFREALFGFEGDKLQKLVIVDKLGQRSVLAFSSVQRNQPVDPQQVSFTLPKGADLIGTPLAP